MSLPEQRIVLVTGKGGVGKTTVSVALGLAAARAGKRTVIVETSGASRVAPLFGRPSAGYTACQIAPNLHTLSITPEAAIEEYIVQQIKFRKLYKMVFRNRVMGAFLDAAPGLNDAVQLGKVFDLERETRPDGRPAWDLVVVDAPATGHGLTMLAAPRRMMDLTRAGPLFDGARVVHELVADPELTAMVLVCLPEEMPVAETLDLWGRLGEHRPLVAMCVLNEVLPPPLAHPADWAPAREALMAHPAPALREAVDLVDAWIERRTRQEAAHRRLQAGLDVPVASLPFLFDRDLDAERLTELGRTLAGGMAAWRRP